MQNQLAAVDPMVLAIKDRVQRKLSPEILQRLDVCLSEALVNLILHAEHPQLGTLIDVNVSFEDDALKVDIYDPKGAAPFDLRDHACVLNDVDTMAENGRGIGLILACADSLDYGAEGDRMRLSLAFWARQ